MERLDRIEAHMDDLREELRGLRLAQSIGSQELMELLRDLRQAVVKLERRPPPSRAWMWLAIGLALASFTLGFVAHWRIEHLEEVSHVQQPFLPPRGPLQDLQQHAPRPD